MYKFIFSLLLFFTFHFNGFSQKERGLVFNYLKEQSIYRGSFFNNSDSTICIVSSIYLRIRDTSNLNYLSIYDTKKEGNLYSFLNVGMDSAIERAFYPYQATFILPHQTIYFKLSITNPKAENYLEMYVVYEKSFCLNTFRKRMTTNWPMKMKATNYTFLLK
jgi:hypothetical protein